MKGRIDVMNKDGPVDVAKGGDGDDRTSTGDIDCHGIEGNHNSDEDHDGKGDIV